MPRNATTRITRYIGPMIMIMLGHRLRGWANISPTKTFQARTTNNYNREKKNSEDFLNTKVLNLGTSKVIFDMFIRACLQKCQPFPTHSTPLSLAVDQATRSAYPSALLFPLNRTQTQAK